MLEELTSTGKKVNQLVGVQSIRLEMMFDISQITALANRATGNRAPPVAVFCCLLLLHRTKEAFACGEGTLVPPPHPRQQHRGCKNQGAFAGCPCRDTARQPATCWSGQQLPSAKRAVWQGRFKSSSYRSNSSNKSDKLQGRRSKELFSPPS